MVIRPRLYIFLFTPPASDIRLGGAGKPGPYTGVRLCGGAEGGIPPEICNFAGKYNYTSKSI